MTVSDFEVHVWRAALDIPSRQLGELAKHLADDEANRAKRFHFTRDRDRFIAARGILRDILSRYCGCGPAEIRFVYRSAGKPGLAPGCGPSDLRFNVSHSHGLALYAVTIGREVGIDVELGRPRVAEERIAERFFSPAEVAALRALPPEQQTEGFFNCWTRKEAYIKARGEGLSIPLGSFDVTLAPGEPAALLEVRHAPADQRRWSVAAVDAGPGYAGAVVAEGFGWSVVRLDWNPPAA